MNSTKFDTDSSMLNSFLFSLNYLCNIKKGKNKSK